MKRTRPTLSGGGSGLGARVSRLLLAAMGDDAERERAPGRGRAALGPTGLMSVKSKRAATEPAAAGGAAGAADAAANGTMNLP